MRKEFIKESSDGSKFWRIEILENTYTITTGKTGTKGKSSSNEFPLREITYMRAEDLISKKIREGFTETKQNSYKKILKRDFPFWDLYDTGIGTKVLVDINDPINIQLVLNALLKKLKKQVPIQKSKDSEADPYKLCYFYGSLNEEGKFISHRIQKLGADVEFTNYDVDSEDFFFKEISRRYPELHPEIYKWVSYAISLKNRVYRTEDDTAFSAAALALALVRKKYIKDFHQFLYTNDCNEEYQYEYIDEVLTKWGVCKKTMPLLVASRSSLDCGPAHDNIYFPDVLDEDDEDQMDFFVKCLLRDVRGGSSGNDKIKGTKGNHRKKLINEAIDFYVEPIFEELEIEVDRDRIFQAIDMLEKHKGIGLKKLQDSKYKIPFVEIEPTEQELYQSGYDYLIRKKKYPEAIKEYSAAIELNPTNADYYTDRGYAHRLNQDKKMAESDWLKAIELDTDNYQSHKNLAIFYQRQSIDYRKSFFHWDKLAKMTNEAEAILNRAYLQELLGNKEDAKIGYKQALEVKEPNVILDYAEILILTSNYKEAIEFVENQRFEKEGNNAVALFLQCSASILNGSDFTPFEKQLRQLVKTNIEFSWWFGGIEHLLKSRKIDAKQKERIQQLIELLKSANK